MTIVEQVRDILDRLTASGKLVQVVNEEGQEVWYPIKENDVATKTEASKQWQAIGSEVRVWHVVGRGGVLVEWTTGDNVIHDYVAGSVWHEEGQIKLWERYAIDGRLATLSQCLECLTQRQQARFRRVQSQERRDWLLYAGQCAIHDDDEEGEENEEE